jgi:hypothetical protein
VRKKGEGIWPGVHGGYPSWVVVRLNWEIASLQEKYKSPRKRNALEVCKE